MAQGRLAAAAAGIATRSAGMGEAEAQAASLLAGAVRAQAHVLTYIDAVSLGGALSRIRYSSQRYSSCACELSRISFEMLMPERQNVTGGRTVLLTYRCSFIQP